MRSLGLKDRRIERSTEVVRKRHYKLFDHDAHISSQPTSLEKTQTSESPASGRFVLHAECCGAVSRSKFSHGPIRQ
jgi:hypothetical protein